MPKFEECEVGGKVAPKDRDRKSSTPVNVRSKFELRVIHNVISLHPHDVRIKSAGVYTVNLLRGRRSPNISHGDTKHDRRRESASRFNRIFTMVPLLCVAQNVIA
ncbi:BQ5605_C047g12322 [Microbotryum silenes-dioicae]|uniref:BQ5605_C047g12322 protein n=1 Tax=Microbotryum silenes-dioicae TaxID=796604 RepID=A0A2X0MTD8_9BASI|nr:BQ5605_C047g12322 [Microbotryum silenes-dioicae]